MDIYSASNDSNETLASEYPLQLAKPRNGHFRAASKMVIPEERDGPESLTMGYAQVVGQFTLDGSLVNQAPFEEVKRKGVVGGSGGGVVGIERARRGTLESLDLLGFSNLGESIGGLARRRAEPQQHWQGNEKHRELQGHSAAIDTSVGPLHRPHFGHGRRTELRLFIHTAKGPAPEPQGTSHTNIISYHHRHTAPERRGRSKSSVRRGAVPGIWHRER